MGNARPAPRPRELPSLAGAPAAAGPNLGLVHPSLTLVPLLTHRVSATAPPARPSLPDLPRVEQIRDVHDEPQMQRHHLEGGVLHLVVRPAHQIAQNDHVIVVVTRIEGGVEHEQSVKPPFRTTVRTPMLRKRKSRSVG